MPCCDLTLFEVPLTDRLTEDPALVTCDGAQPPSEELKETLRNLLVYGQPGPPGKEN